MPTPNPPEFRRECAGLLSTQDLNGPWTLELVEGPQDAAQQILETAAIPATVPGQVHTDLMAAGLLDNPDIGFGEAEQMWIGNSTWRYRRSFIWDPAQLTGARTDLVAEGLDTFATVSLNGQEIAHTTNQHIAHRWDVSELLLPGENVLDITFSSAWEAAREAEKRVGPLPRPYDEPYSFVRKSACNFGWDWGPHYVTAGIWKPIRLESWAGARIEAVRPHVSLQGQARDAFVELSVDLEHAVLPADLTVLAVLRGPDGRTVAESSTRTGASQEVRLLLHVENPQLWWPLGLGEQPLYDLTVELLDGETRRDIHTQRTGLRTVAVQETPDSKGSTWAIAVNDRRVRVRGYNWIPEDPFISEITTERLHERLDQAVAGGANLLRVWGGGYFSSEEFMAGCDERGLMVWHDFLFACSAYDESPDMIDSVRTEAEQAVARLAKHPSLVMWCGGNECVWGMYDWGWPAILHGRTWGAAFYTEILPEVVNRLSPGTPYVANSPWSGSIDVHPNDAGSGPVHIWDVWNDVDFAHYRDVDPTFVSEMGWCAPPAWTTLRTAVPEGDLLPDNPGVIHHMRAADGMEKLARGLAPYFGAPDRAEDWHYLTQVIQARSQVAGAEWLRSRQRCAGVVIWQLNDCWPVLSWAAVDNAGIEKPVWYGLRRSFAPQLLTIQPVTAGDTWNPAGTEGLEVIIVNDGLTRWDAPIVIRRLTMAGEEVARTTVDLSAGTDDTARHLLPRVFADSGNGASEFLVAASGSKRSIWFFAPDSQLELHRPEYAAEGEVLDGSLVVTVTAHSLLLDLCLFADRLAETMGLPGNALTVDQMLVTLLPDESARFRVSRRDGLPIDPSLDLEPALRWPILRAVGDAAAILPAQEAAPAKMRV
ncbi:MAG TPA: glycoside hydrolase family 2 protein [Cryobacterium sp.]|nr:glycoside hydrolase family 2 protein [Cryobacterium sp.]